MKILILAAGYPDNNGYMGQAYIRTRNLFYKENGIEVIDKEASMKIAEIRKSKK